MYGEKIAELKDILQTQPGSFSRGTTHAEAERMRNPALLGKGK